MGRIEAFRKGWRGARGVLMIGLVLGLLLALMKLMELSYLTRDLTMEAYLAGVALLFLLTGGMVGRRFFPRSTEVDRLEKVGNSNVDELVSQLDDTGQVTQVRSAPWGELSDREFEILELIALGKTNREIAEKLFLSPNTIKSHVSNIYRKLDVGRRPEAVARAKELAILQ